MPKNASELKRVAAVLTLEFDPERVDTSEMEDMLEAHNEDNPSMEAHGFKVVTTRVSDHPGAAFETPNLDCMEDGEVGDMGDLFQLLADYCERKRQATSRRMQGNIGAAVTIEKQMESLYHQLPAAYRW